ncbi:MAG: radical SAM protein [Nitrospirae bacterium]|nr:radical SAM protein [Nitrospirota bacterium]
MTSLAVNGNLQEIEGSVFNVSRPEVRRYREAWTLNPTLDRPGPFPLHLDLESTSVCNLKCTFCATTYFEYDRGFLDPDLCKAIVDEGAREGLASLKFNVRGEPLLHKDLPKMVSYAKQKGVIDVFFNTNGTGLTEHVAEALVEAGLDRIIVSFEGYEKKFYESHRVGATFEKVVRNVRRLREIRKRKGVSWPQIRLQSVKVPGLDVERYVEFWSPIADQVTCLDLRDERSPADVGASDWACPCLWQRLTVTWDGMILLCPYMNKSPRHYQFNGFGRFPEMSIKEAWLGERAREFRRLHRAGRAHEVDPCSKCSHRASEVGKLRAGTPLPP